MEGIGSKNCIQIYVSYKIFVRFVCLLRYQSGGKFVSNTKAMKFFQKKKKNSCVGFHKKIRHLLKTPFSEYVQGV